MLLVTGASGFLGAHVVAEAIQRGRAVRAGMRRSSDRSRLDALAPQAQTAWLDLDDSATLDAALAGCTAIIHCAAYGVDYRQSDFYTALETNVAATMRLAEAAASRGVRLVHVGTSYEYGTQDGLLAEDRVLSPTGIYGVTKAAGTLAVQDFARRTGADCTVLRPFSMYGPLEGTHKIVAAAMRASLAGEMLDLSPGAQERDYLYVADVAAACIDVATAATFPRGEILNICSGEGLSLRALLTAAAQAVGGNEGVFRWGAKAYRPAESMRVVGDPARIAKVLRWRATTSLAEGMAATARWELERLQREGESS
ncbi:NAD-dependent epimerase/dehydratase family protein [Sphingomonas qomolangmaensis]|uniref:NAD(P)-dependent oxidoreductase n=1 Tax=Sphingomonas qomolangmaensis TaxID=2918765 RepID=A0ABY5L5W5_9SPHN|nr:NAD(P)-dependent oxidoreductase [Sphingomonas qomolangmaensis]UUL82167.1 NAD(P)-dependent oxidoreductase [Sphingomonas qomolangmaensis]